MNGKNTTAPIVTADPQTKVNGYEVGGLRRMRNHCLTLAGQLDQMATFARSNPEDAKGVKYFAAESEKWAKRAEVWYPVPLTKAEQVAQLRRELAALEAAPA